MGTSAGPDVQADYPHDSNVVEIVVDSTYPTSPIDLYYLMFDSEWFERFLKENQKVWDLELEEWRPRKGDPSLQTRNYHYTKPMTGVGPKEVQCNVTEENQHRDESDYVSTRTTTYTPGVPYGGAFHVVTDTHIAWADNREQGCVVNITSEVVWTGFCPFRGLVEGRAFEGQKKYAVDMDTAIRDYLAAQAMRHSGARDSKREVRARMASDAVWSRSAGKAELGPLSIELENAPRARILSQFIPLVLLSIVLTLLVLRLTL